MANQGPRKSKRLQEKRVREDEVVENQRVSPEQRKKRTPSKKRAAPKKPVPAAVVPAADLEPVEQRRVVKARRTKKVEVPAENNVVAPMDLIDLRDEQPVVEQPVVEQPVVEQPVAQGWKAWLGNLWDQQDKPTKTTVGLGAGVVAGQVTNNLVNHFALAAAIEAGERNAPLVLSNLFQNVVLEPVRGYVFPAAVIGLGAYEVYKHREDLGLTGNKRLRDDADNDVESNQINEEEGVNKKSKSKPGRFGIGPKLDGG